MPEMGFAIDGAFLFYITAALEFNYNPHGKR